MNKLGFILLAFVLVFAACKKDEEENKDELQPTAKQKGFSIEWTSITCSICGASGGPLIHKYQKDAPNSVNIALHVNSSDAMKIENNIYFGFSGDRPSGGGIPSFWVGDEKVSTSGSDNKMIDLVKSGDAIAGIDYTYEKSGNTFTVTTKTKFFSAGTGEYTMSIFLLEDGIDGSSTAATGYKQAGASYSYPNDDYKHDFVMRAALQNVMGDVIATNPTSGKEIDKTFKITSKSEWKKVYPVVVLWKHDPNATIKYSFVNAMRKKK
jgi:hypothetical protein